MDTMHVLYQVGHGVPAVLVPAWHVPCVLDAAWCVGMLPCGMICSN